MKQALVEQFRCDGFIPVGRVLTEPELAEVREAYDRIFQAVEKPSGYRNIAERGGEANSTGAVLQIIDMHKLDDVFRRLLFKPLLLDLASALMEAPSVRLYHDQALYKPALHGDEVVWHQDNG